MTTALDRYRPLCEIRPDVRVERRTEHVALPADTVWCRVTTWRVYGSAAIRPYAADGDTLPLPLSITYRRFVPQDITPRAPTPAGRRPNRFERDWSGHDSIHDAKVESRRNAALSRGATTAADFLGDD